MNYIGKWKVHSIGIMGEDALVYLSPEEYIKAPMSYIDETDEEAVRDELNERKTLAGMELRILEDGRLFMLMPLPDSASQEEIDAAIAAGEISVYDGMLYENSVPWEERDGALWFDSGITGEAFGEMTDSWVKATDDNGFFNFMTLRFVKSE